MRIAVFLAVVFCVVLGASGQWSGFPIPPIPPIPGVDWDKVKDDYEDDVVDEIASGVYDKWKLPLNVSHDDLKASHDYLEELIKTYKNKTKTELKAILDSKLKDLSDIQLNLIGAGSDFLKLKDEIKKSCDDSEKQVEHLKDLVAGVVTDDLSAAYALGCQRVTALNQTINQLNITYNAGIFDLRLTDQQLRLAETTFIRALCDLKNTTDAIIKAKLELDLITYQNLWASVLALKSHKQTLTDTLKDKLDDYEDEFKAAKDKLQSDVDRVKQDVFKTYSEVADDLKKKGTDLIKNITHDLTTIYDGFQECTGTHPTSGSTVSIIVSCIRSEINQTIGDDSKILSLLSAISAVHLGVKVSDIEVTKTIVAKRQTTTTFNIDIKHTTDVKTDYGNFTLSVDIKIDASALDALRKNAESEIKAWLATLGSKTAVELQNILAQLQAQKDQITADIAKFQEDADHKLADLKQNASHWHDDDDKEDDDDDNDDDKEEDSHHAQQYFEKTEKYLNNTIRVLSVLVAQKSLALSLSMKAILDAKIALVNFEKGLLTLSAIEQATLKATTLPLLLSTAVLANQGSKIAYYYLNITLQKFEEWKDELEDQMKDSKEKLERIVKGQWKAISDVKKEFKDKLDHYKQVIQKLIEDSVANCTITAQNFDDVSSSSSTLTLTWSLSLTVPDIPKIKTIIANILSSYTTTPSSSIKVDISPSQKRATGYTAAAVVSSPSSTSSDTPSSDNTYAIIGGVVGAVILVAIFIIVAVVILRKNPNENV